MTFGAATPVADADRGGERADRRFLHRSRHRHRLHLRAAGPAGRLHRFQQRRLSAAARRRQLHRAGAGGDRGDRGDRQPGAAANVWPVQNNSFIAGTTTYTVNVSVAYANAAGPYWPMVAGRFIVPQAGAAVQPRLPGDRGQDRQGHRRSRATSFPRTTQFSPDGNVVYAVNAVNVAKATNEAQLPRPTDGDAGLSRARR